MAKSSKLNPANMKAGLRRKLGDTKRRGREAEARIIGKAEVLSQIPAGTKKYTDILNSVNDLLRRQPDSQMKASGPHSIGAAMPMRHACAKSPASRRLDRPREVLFPETQFNRSLRREQLDRQTFAPQGNA